MKKGWQLVPMGQLCSISSGESDAQDAVEDGAYAFFDRSRTIKKSSRFLYDCEALIIPGEGKEFLPRHFTGKFDLHQRAYALFDFTNRIDPRFLYFYLYHFSHYLPSVAVGATVKSLRRRHFDELPVAVTTLPEQQRIVGVLNEAFAGLATAQANAEKNRQNARALFESHLQTIFTQRGEGWVEKTLGDTCEMYQPKTIGTKDLIPDGPYPVFGANGIIGRYDKYNHEKPQLLITCRGATCGSVNISDPNSWITGNAMVVRPLDHSLDFKLIEFIFRGGIDISKAITGAAQPQITRTNLSPLVIRFPASVPEQKRLASIFEDLATETKRLESLYQKKIITLAALKKSLLHQAFTGAL